MGDRSVSFFDDWRLPSVSSKGDPVFLLKLEDRWDGVQHIGVEFDLPLSRLRMLARDGRYT